MKLLIVAIGLQLISESLQRLMGFSEIREKVIEQKSFDAPSLQQSSCRTDTWSDFNFCSNCTACNVTDYWGQRSLNVTCKPCDGFYYYSSDTYVRVQNVSSWGQPSTYQYRTDCNYGSDTSCRWNATVTIDSYSYRGYNCQPIRQNGTENCRNEVYGNYWSNYCSNCTFCNSTTYNGSQTSNATCVPCNNYTWTNWNRSVQTTSKTNYSSADNTQRFWYADCNNTYAPISECNYCWTCVKSDYWSVGWNCDTCKAWTNQSNGTNNTNCNYNSYSDWDSTYGRYVSANCSACNTTDSRGNVLNSWVTCWPGYNYNYINNDYSLHAYNTTNYSSSDNIQRVFTSDCQNPYVSVSQNCRFSISCTKQSYSWFGYDCFFSYVNNSNTTNTTKTMVYYNWDQTRYINMQSECTFSVSGSSNSSLQSCRPLNYSWSTWNTTVRGPIYVYNYSSEDTYTQYFTTDCTGSAISDCYWVTACSRYRYASVGFYCWVYNGKANSSNSSNTTTTTYFDSYDYYRGMYIYAQCNYTNNTYNKSIYCQPYSYSYATNDYYVKQETVYNSSTGQYDNLFYTDCGYNAYPNNCYWVTKCFGRSNNNSLWCTVSNLKGSNSSNSTNKTNAFRFEIGYGTDWCANCTQNNGTNGTTSVSCQPCTSYTPYTSVRCTTQLTYFQNTFGGSTCANCTSCNNGFFYCQPCGGFINAELAGVPATQVEAVPFDQEFWEDK